MKLSAGADSRCAASAKLFRGAARGANAPAPATRAKKPAAPHHLIAQQFGDPESGPISVHELGVAMSHGTDKPSVDARRAERLARAKMLSGHFASRSEDGDEEPPRKKPQRGGASGGGISFNVSGAAMPAGRGMAMRGRGIAGRGAGVRFQGSPSCRSSSQGPSHEDLR